MFISFQHFCLNILYNALHKWVYDLACSLSICPWGVLGHAGIGMDQVYDYIIKWFEFRQEHESVRTKLMGGD